MDSLILSLVSLLLVAGGGRSSWQQAGFSVTAAAVAAVPDSETPSAYWRTVLPGVPIPPAINDLLTEANTGDKTKHLVENLENTKKDKLQSIRDPRFITEPRTHGPQLGGRKFRNNFLYAIDDKAAFSYKPRSKEDQNKVTYSIYYKDDEKNVTFSYKPPSKEDHKKVTYGLYNEDDQKKVTFSYELPSKENQKKVVYGLYNEDDEKNVTFSYKLPSKENQKKVTYESYSEDDQNKVTLPYNPPCKEDQKKVIYGLYNEDKQKKAFLYNKPKRGMDQEKVTFSYMMQNDEDEKKVAFSYSPWKEGDKRMTFSHQSHAKDHDQNKGRTILYDPVRDDQKKVTFSYDIQNEEDQKKVTFSYNGKNEDGYDRIKYFYKPLRENDPKKTIFSYVPRVEDNQKKVTFSYKPYNEEDQKSTNDKNMITTIYSNLQRLADVFFLEDRLRTGSVITPTIPRTTSLPPLLRRDVANSIPFSIDHLGDILSMFAPASLSIADEIRWVLEKCDSPWPLTSEKMKAGCATSMEDLVELPMSLLGTRRLRAFSAAGMPPVEAASDEPRGRYAIMALHRISSSEMVTCHDMTYPHAVFYCHMTGPATRAYMVALASEGAGAEPATMETVAVCHLDTSRWSPEHPFLQALHARPGDVEACHFLPKSSVVWVPVVGPGGRPVTQ